MVRLKKAYWEFDFEAVCPTLDHDLLSQAHIVYTQDHFICKLGKILSELKLLSGVYYLFLKLYTGII